MEQSAKDRVFQAADELYKELNGDRFPTVDSVRKRAGCSMADAVQAMQEWRRTQTVKAKSMDVDMPTAVKQAIQTAGSAIWQVASDVATEALKNAQRAWEAEKNELEVASAELAASFDAIQLQLDSATNTIAEMQKNKANLEAQLASANEEIRNHEMANKELQGQHDTMKEQNAKLMAHIKEATEALQSAQRKWDDEKAKLEATIRDLSRDRDLLKEQLDTANETVAELKKAVTDIEAKLADTINEMEAKHATSIADLKAKHEAVVAEKDAEISSATLSIHKLDLANAELQGQLNALKEQQTELLKRVRTDEFEAAHFS